jgi:homeobox protein cut-like
MEGGVDTEERSSLEAAQDNARPVTGAEEDAAEENKFQTAIGAWRSRTGLRLY